MFSVIRRYGKGEEGDGRSILLTSAMETAATRRPNLMGVESVLRLLRRSQTPMQRKMRIEVTRTSQRRAWSVVTSSLGSVVHLQPLLVRTFRGTTVCKPFTRITIYYIGSWENSNTSPSHLSSHLQRESQLIVEKSNIDRSKTTKTFG